MMSLGGSIPASIGNLRALETLSDLPFYNLINFPLLEEKSYSYYFSSYRP